MYQPVGTQSEWHDETTEQIPSYLSRLTTVPLLLPEEERELSRLAKGGDETAKRRLIEANMRLVLNIAKHYRNRAVPFEDLVQEGAIGLMNAVERFDPDRGYRFSTYATHWIRQTIGRAIGNKGKAIRLPAHITDALRKIERARTLLLRELGRDPTVEEISAACDITPERLLILLQCAQDPISLDMMVGEDENTDLGSLISDPSQADPESAMLNREAIRHLQAILADLTERERRVMRRRLGLDEEQNGAVLGDIGREMSLSRERIRQIEIQALKKLRLLAQRRRLRDLFSE
jgi:RNA polymerase primary sigma factor